MNVPTLFRGTRLTTASMAQSWRDEHEENERYLFWMGFKAKWRREFARDRWINRIVWTILAAVFAILLLNADRDLGQAETATALHGAAKLNQGREIPIPLGTCPCARSEPI